VKRSNNIAAMADELALTVPFLQRGVTQFIVEFAGDFMNQKADGTLVDSANPEPDGVIDFVMRPVAGQVVKQIRWYGMPRNVDVGDDDTSGPKIQGTPAGQANPNNMWDVVPVRDVCVNASVKLANMSLVEGTSNMEHFASGPQSTQNYAAVGAMPAGARYICTWTPRMLASGRGPWLIRITMTITDPNGRLPEGQTVQYVFSLPQ
jgi:hypothetical protein